MSGFSIEGRGNMIDTGNIERAFSPEFKSEGIESSGNSVKDTARSFAEVFEKSLAEVNQDQISADHAIKDLVSGKSKNIHETMLTIEKADSSLKMMMQVRNKILDAYREIMRMQV